MRRTKLRAVNQLPRLFTQEYLMYLTDCLRLKVVCTFVTRFIHDYLMSTVRHGAVTSR